MFHCFNSLLFDIGGYESFPTSKICLLLSLPLDKLTLRQLLSYTANSEVLWLECYRLTPQSLFAPYKCLVFFLV